jgi:hypothetical protein
MTKEAEAAALSQDVVDSRPVQDNDQPTASVQASPAPVMDAIPASETIPASADPAQTLSPGASQPAAPVAATALPVPPTLRPAGR